MPEGTFVPPWISRDYDPVGTFMRAYQTGAQISEAQSRLAEQERQANMEAQARSEQLQANMLRAMTETAVQKEYQQQQIGLRQQELAQEKVRYDALGQDAAARIAETIRHNQMMESLRQQQMEGDVTPEQMQIGDKTFLVNRKTGHFQELRDPNRAFQQSIAKAEAADILKRKHTAEAKQKEEGLEQSKRDEFQKQVDALSTEYGAKLAPWTNAPAVRPSGPQAKPDTEALRAEARAAIQRGKDPDAVRKRFREMTGEEL